MAKLIYGKVVKKSSDKTVSVLVQTSTTHPIYKKVIKKNRKFLVHDPLNSCNVGDMVTAKSCSPISKNKSFCVVKEAIK